MLVVQFENGNKIEEECDLDTWLELGTMVLWMIWGKQSPLHDVMARCFYVVK